MAYVHIVDDDPGIRETLSEQFEFEGYEVSAFSSAEEALPVVLQEPPDVILLDLRLPGMNGIEYLAEVRKLFKDIEIIMITGYGDVPSAVKAMKLGARDYISKPFEIDEISLLVRKAVEAKKKGEQLAYLQQEARNVFRDIIGASKPMQEVFKFIHQVSGSHKTTVLIRGETGTGKELVARAIHYNSPRANKPFIETNCSAIHANLLESELFGHEAGAFTGAKQRKKGLMEIAHGGTFFLDEIGDMSRELQSKLLKVIEEQNFRRVGGTKEVKVDIRIISASSRNLLQIINEGKFRKDLFYRLNVAAIELPPLRDRGDDIVLLADHFIKLYSSDFKRDLKGMTPEVKSLFLEHSWPGNVRELRNAIERAVLFEKGEYLSLDCVGLIHIPQSQELSPLSRPVSPLDIQLPPEGLSLAKVEKSIIKKALHQTKGNQTQAAKLLGISREKLKYRMKKFNVSR